MSSLSRLFTSVLAAVGPSRRRLIANRRAVISAAVARFLYGRASEYVSGCRLPPACCPACPVSAVDLIDLSFDPRAQRCYSFVMALFM